MMTKREQEIVSDMVAEHYREVEELKSKCIPSKAIKIFTEEYRKAQMNSYVRKPMAYAFYKVWKYYDSHEKPRMVGEQK